MKTNLKRIAAGTLMFAVLTGIAKMDVLAAQENYITASGPAEVAEILAAFDTDDYFAAVNIDPDTDIVEADGEPASFEEIFDVTKRDAEGILKSSETVETYFRETPYETEVEADGTVTVTAPFQTCRIVVWDEMPEDDYGAVKVISCPMFQEYVLIYKTPEETQEAYELLQKQYGEKNCFTDRIYSADEICAEYSPYSWGTTAMGMDTLKNSEHFETGNTMELTGSALAAVIDTGCETGHEVFAGRISEDSYNFADGTREVYDNYESGGHGTSVASILADATPDNVKLLILQISNAKGYASSLGFANAMLYALQKGADVISMSIVVKSATAYEWDYALEKIYNANIPFAAGSGNDNKDVSGYYPASSRLTIAVSAVDQNNEKCGFSNFGSGIDFCAPGKALTVASAKGGYASSGGTSLSTPYIAAAISYIKLIHPEYTTLEVYETLKKYSVDLGDLGKDEKYGWGMPVIADYLSEELSGSGHIHNWQITEKREADCLDGYVEYLCACGEKRRRAFAAISEHTWGEVQLMPDGFYQYACLTCNETHRSPSSCGPQLSWSISGSVLTISGSGSMSDYEIQKFPWSELNQKIQTVVIKKDVGKIADGAFAYCPGLTEFQVEKGNTAYENNSGMALYTAGRKELAAVANGYPPRDNVSVGWGTTAAKIHNYAFAGCKKVSAFAMKADNTEIGAYAFADCTGLRKISVWGNISSIGENAFLGVNAEICQSADISGQEKQYGGSLTWKKHSYSGTVVQPSYTAEGQVSYTCGCGAERKEKLAVKSLSRPVILDVSNVSKGVKIAWAKVTGAAGYVIYRDGKEIKKITNGNTAAFTDSGANKNGRKYKYTLLAIAGTNKSRASSPQITYYMSRTSISEVKNLSAKKVHVRWKKNAKASGYQIKYVTGSRIKYISVKGKSCLEKTIAGLSKRKSCKIYVRAYKKVSGKKYFSCWSRGAAA